MISTVRGRQNFSKASQDQGFKSDGVQTLSSQDKAKSIGEENVGDVLNKVADPNWVDPVKTRKVGNNQLDKDAFLKLMLAQMKNQDPTTPLQSHEMAAQLAQFTSLEQLSNINTNIEGLRTQSNPSVNYQALNFIGKQVAGDTSRLTRGAGDKEHGFNFTLSGDAVKVKVKVFDGEGNEVRKMEFGNLKKGANAVKWNGLTEDGQPARPGQYKFSIDAVGSNGGKLYAQTEFKGKITGLNYTSDGPVLLVGDQSIRMQDVSRIEEAGVGSAASGAVRMPGAAVAGAGLPNFGPQTNSALSSGNHVAQAAMQSAAQSSSQKVSPQATSLTSETPQVSPEQLQAFAASVGLSQTPPPGKATGPKLIEPDMSKNKSTNSSSAEQPNAGAIARNVPMERGMLDKFNKDTTKETAWNAKPSEGFATEEENQ